MAERRTLAAGLNVVPQADPETVRRFITQEPAPAAVAAAAAPPPAERETAPADPEPPRPKRSALKPVGLIPVTVRLRPEIASALKRASLERQLAGEEVYTQQDIVEEAITPWLKSRGFL